MTRIHRTWMVYLLALLVLASGVLLTVEADKAKRFVATANPGPGLVSQATSGPPLQVASSAVVANLNADLLDGQHATAYLLAQDLKTPAGREKLGLGAEIGPPGITANRFRATANPGPGFISLATSGPPLEVNSTGRVANLNADLLDGLDSAAFAAAAHTHPGSDITSAVAQATNAANADLLDGLDSSAFAAAVHGHDVSEITGAATLGANSFSGDQSVTGTVTATGFVGDGSGLTNIPSSQLTGPNPLQVALLRWYQANQSGAAFAVGNFPEAVAFDGANIWVTNAGSSTVSKLRASDGATLGAFAVGDGPLGVAFDGANIWVTNSSSGTVSKLRASDGATLGTFAVVGNNPQGVAFDGANIWVVNNVGTVTKLRTSDGATLGTFVVGSNPFGVAFDGANIWVTNASGSNTVTKLRASDGANLGTFAVGDGPRGLAFDGANIWVANQDSNTVTKLRASDGANLGDFAVGNGPMGVAFDGANLWVPNGDDNTVTKLRASDGANLGTFAVGAQPLGVAFDGANIWVANSNSNTVSKL